MDGEGWKGACDMAMREKDITDPLDPSFVPRAGELFDLWWKSSDLDEKKRHFKEATFNVDKLWSTTELLNDPLHALLQSIVIQAWSSLEVLIEDLCRYSIKLGSASLSVPTEKQWRSLGFRSRNKFRATYDFVFPSDNAKIKNILRSQEIDSLALVRNVLVHKAGIIDDEFMKGSKFNPQLDYYRSLGEGAEILMTGYKMRSLVDPCMPLGYDLGNTVNSWLFAHP